MSTPSAPVAKQVEHVRTFHGDSVDDPYEWLRDKESPEVIAHLEAENAYTAAVTDHLEPLRQSIFEEIRARTKETDLSVPVALGGWWYYSRTFAGKQYATHCRVRVTDPDTLPDLETQAVPDGEQVLLDGNQEAGDNTFFALGAFEVDHSGQRLAYAVDLSGDERFALKLKGLDSGEVIDDAVSGIGYGVVWSLDGRFVFYTRVDEAWRPHEVWRHEVGTPVEDDVLVYTEADERFWMEISASRDDRWVVISLGSRTTSEALLIDAADPRSEPRIVAPRRQGVEYEVEPAGDRLLIVHNAGDPDFEIAQAPLDATSHEQWVALSEPTPGERIVGVDAFAAHVVVALRRDGLTGVRVLARDPQSESGFGQVHDLSFEESVYQVHPAETPEYASTRLRLSYDSLVTPSSVYDYDLDARTMTLLKRREVLGGYDPSQYVQWREWVSASDGTQVPMSLLAKIGVEPDGTAPGLLQGYGAYEISSDPYFSVARLSMVDRGFVFAVAHVRGGGELGRRWYDQGKMMSKQNTFTDFVACAEHLVESRWVAPDRLVAAGGSAGGLLMGAVANLAPERFRAIHAAVPFVDALTTILDPTLPLTVIEWEEWGDPLHQPEAYAYMKGYTPYENIAATTYPAILATTSLNDTRVFYVEPAKWVQRLRSTVTSDQGARPVLLKTEMVAGHGGKSGRYDAWHDTAFELAFLIDQVGAS